MFCQAGYKAGMEYLMRRGLRSVFWFQELGAWGCGGGAKVTFVRKRERLGESEELRRLFPFKFFFKKIAHFSTKLFTFYEKGEAEGGRGPERVSTLLLAAPHPAAAPNLIFPQFMQMFFLTIVS